MERTGQCGARVTNHSKESTCLVTRFPSIWILAAGTCTITRRNLSGKWIGSSYPERLRSDVRSDETVVTDWFTCIIGASVSFTNSARIEFEASSWNTYLFLPVGSKTVAALAVCDVRGMAAAEAAMRWPSWRVSIGFLLLLFSALAVPNFAQQAADSVNVVLVVGLSGVKERAKGTLTVENGNLQFVHSKAKAVVATTAIQDVVTGNDSQRMIHGFVGTLTMFAPYESGRFLSLFRSKLDTLTITYRDSDGGLHGAIFTMVIGKAEPLKKLMVAQGAHTSIPTQDSSSGSNPKTDAAKEQKP